MAILLGFGRRASRESVRARIHSAGRSRPSGDSSESCSDGRVKIGLAFGKAAEVFGEQVYDRVALADISYSARNRKGAIYSYSAAKVALLQIILSLYMHRALKELTKNVGPFLHLHHKVRIPTSRHIQPSCKHLGESHLIPPESRNLPLGSLELDRALERTYVVILEFIVTDMLKESAISFGKPLSLRATECL